MAKGGGEEVGVVYIVDLAAKKEPAEAGQTTEEPLVGRFFQSRRTSPGPTSSRRARCGKKKKNRRKRKCWTRKTSSKVAQGPRKKKHGCRQVHRDTHGRPSTLQRTSVHNNITSPSTTTYEATGSNTAEKNVTRKPETGIVL
jgi:hypothetical protein